MCVPANLPLTHAMMDEMSELVAQAYLDALALCEKEGVATSWICVGREMKRFELRAGIGVAAPVGPRPAPN